jgi:CheY-like chemotaxis protein
MRILVADDDVDVREAMRELLMSAGHEVRTASDGRELMQLIAGWRTAPAPDLPDLLLTDVQMPHYSGLDVIAALRLVRLDLPVIVFSGMQDPSTREESARLGVAAVLPKPVDAAVLLRAIEAAVAPRAPAAVPAASR